ncbi:hypothetical protein HZC09_04275 [Candidatus Micrarchaeota archaeon]|nr:hypothetical protein [Candidatus Micrarchaeota archaeon]
MDESEVREAYLRKIIERYKDAVNLQEQKNIAELKALLKPNPAILSLKDKLDREPFEEYARACFAFVSSFDTIHIPLPVSFWLKTEDILELGAGDPMDKAVFLTSLLNLKGAKAFLRVVVLENGMQHALVWFNLSENLGPDADRSAPPVWLLDPVHNVLLKAGSLEEAFGEYGKTHVIKKSVYEFNEEEYREL